MTKSIFENIIANCDFEQALPLLWKGIDYNRFSQHKNLYPYQREALKHATILLYQYYQDPTLTTQARKKAFLQHTSISKQQQAHFTYPKKKNYIYNLLTDYFTEENNHLPPHHFINRMSFWMATGSGKSLVLIKLIELLQYLMASSLVPHKDILILTHRADLIEQIKREITLFNQYTYQERNIKFIPRDLREFPQIKIQGDLLQETQINIYYHRSDLISNIQKENIIDFKNYDNNGNWFLILDEAHKGEKEDSKRKQYYNILSRNAFLFNFSATFTDPIDLLTTAYNLNLPTYIQKGFGKHLYLSQEQFRNFKYHAVEKDFQIEEKQKIVLMSLILFTLIKKQAETLNKSFPQAPLYHNPLLLTLVNSVTSQEGDLGLFFQELKKIAMGQCEAHLFQEAKKSLIKDLQGNLQFEIQPPLNTTTINNIEKITPQDLWKYVFNTSSQGDFEVRKNPKNNHELSLRVKSGAHSKPFALIKIGDTKTFQKNHLAAYNIEEEYEDISLFQTLDQSSINILMGSRAFYEGWDSNRPNIINFVNIGKNKDAKKFILQSIGRGIRIEPLKNHRKRLQYLINDHTTLPENLKEKTAQVKPLETLFVFGTNRNAVQSVLTSLESEEFETEYPLDLFEKTPTQHPLLIPVYKEVTEANHRKRKKLHLHEDDLQLFNHIMSNMDPRIIALNYHLSVEDIELLTKQHKDYPNRFQPKDKEKIGNPAILLKHIRDYYNTHSEEVKTFKPLQEEINHYHHIKVNASHQSSRNAISFKRIEELKEKITQVKNAPKFQAQKQSLMQSFKGGHTDVETFMQKLEQLQETTRSQEETTFTHSNDNIQIKRLPQHYYIPSIISLDNKITWMKHIIDTPSEIRFIHALEKHLKQSNHALSSYDWWMFSKVDHSLDTAIRIPYIDPTNGKRDFLPDFIFWLQKGNQYHILYIDPKGIGRQEYKYKVDGYSQLFEENNEPKTFHYQDKILKVHLRFATEDKALLATKEAYAKYWFEPEKFDLRIN